MVLLDENPGSAGWVGAALAVPAVVLLTRTGDSVDRAVIARCVAAGLVIGFSAGVALVSFGSMSEDAGVRPILAIVGAATLVIALAKLPARWSLPAAPAIRRGAIAVGAVDQIGFIMLVVAFQIGRLSVVSVIIGLSPLPTIILARLLLGHPLRRPQMAGIVLGTLAVAILATA